MAEVDSARLTSPDRVTTCAGSVFRGARAKPNSLGRSMRPSSSGGVVYMSFCPLSTQFTVRKYRDILVTNCATANNMSTTIRCKMHVTNRLGQKTEEAQRCSFFNILEQSSSAIGGNNSSAIRMRSLLGVENFPRRDNFRDTNDIDFTKEFAESLADRL